VNLKVTFNSRKVNRKNRLAALVRERRLRHGAAVTRGKYSLFLAAAVATGCKGAAHEERAPAAVPAAEPAPAPTSRDVAPSPEPISDRPLPEPRPKATVVVLDPGSAPRRLLRLQVKAGERQRLEMPMKQKLVVKTDEGTYPFPQPPTTAAMEVEVLDVTGDGDVRFAYRFGETRFGPVEGGGEVDAATRAAMTELDGVSMSLVMSSRGEVREVGLLGDAAADPQKIAAVERIAPFFDLMSVPFPLEPVGTGARWQVKQRMMLWGFVLDQIVSCRLVSFDGRRYELEVQFAPSAGPQPFHPPGLPPGVKLELGAVAGTGRYTIAGDLAQMMPSSSRFALVLRARADVTEEGRRQPVYGELELELEHRPGRGPKPPAARERPNPR
jgi:hypothetical protein